MESSTRRKFLMTATTSLAATSALLLRRAHAIEPIARSGTSVMKLSLAAYSFNRQFRAKEIDLYKFIDYCATLGIPGTELTSYYFPEPITSEYLCSLKRRAHVAGLSLSGGAIGNDFTVKAGPELDKQMALVTRWIEHYAALGAPTIRVFSGRARQGEKREEALERAVRNMEHACELAGKRGIFLALENHGGLTETAEGMLELIKAVKSPWFGVNFDSGNFHGKDPYAELAMIAPYTVSVQIKVGMRMAGRREPADLGRIIGILRDARYRGWIALEYEEQEDPYKAIPRYIEQLKELTAG